MVAMARSGACSSCDTVNAKRSSSKLDGAQLVLRALERQYFKLASRPGDTELSLRVIRLLWPLYGQTPEELNVRFDHVLANHKDLLTRVFADAAQTPADRSAFLFQPEVLMI